MRGDGSGGSFPTLRRVDDWWTTAPALFRNLTSIQPPRCLSFRQALAIRWRSAVAAAVSVAFLAALAILMARREPGLGRVWFIATAVVSVMGVLNVRHPLKRFRQAPVLKAIVSKLFPSATTPTLAWFAFHYRAATGERTVYVQVPAKPARDMIGETGAVEVMFAVPPGEHACCLGFRPADEGSLVGNADDTVTETQLGAIRFAMRALPWDLAPQASRSFVKTLLHLVMVPLGLALAAGLLAGGFGGALVAAGFATPRTISVTIVGTGVFVAALGLVLALPKATLALVEIWLRHKLERMPSRGGLADAPLASTARIAGRVRPEPAPGQTTARVVVVRRCDKTPRGMVDTTSGQDFYLETEGGGRVRVMVNQLFLLPRPGRGGCVTLTEGDRVVVGGVVGEQVDSLGESAGARAPQTIRSLRSEGSDPLVVIAAG